VDRLIKRFSSVLDGDLRICESRGIAFQADMKQGLVNYDRAYFDCYVDLVGTAIAKSLNDGRREMVERYWNGPVLDVGIGSGEFLDRCPEGSCGLDVNPHAIEMLKATGRWAEDIGSFGAVTFWDALEHIEAPEIYLKRIARGAFVFVAIPIMPSLSAVRESKHYKPGEHLYYFTEEGFVAWMALYGYRLLEVSTHEMDAGRESIGAFAFCKDLPAYDEHIEAYRQMHAARHYGSSATELHLEVAAKVVRAKHPKSILDYGCGRSDLVAHFWRDGERRIARYDPAIPAHRHMPEDRFDLVLCCDVMEHIPMACVDHVLKEIKSKATQVFFTISTKLAKAKLPDGRNAHVTLLSNQEWARWLGAYFGHMTQLPSRWEHDLILVTGVVR